MVLVESAGKTTLTLTMTFESREARDVALESGMEQGMELGFTRLDEIFDSLRAA